MFTGIIQHIGRVAEAGASAGGVRLEIDLGPLSEDLSPGDSVAVDGLCLTASAVARPAGRFDVMGESLKLSTLGEFRPGRDVNLERAIPAGGRLDGHVVQGHVDGTAEVVSVRRGGQWLIEFSAERAMVEQMAPKGSIAVDGVSLTLARVERGRFSVALIPTTLAETTLKALQPGRRVNIELDIIGKYVRRYLQQMLNGGTDSAGGLTLEKLRQAGFE